MSGTTKNSDESMNWSNWIEKSIYKKQIRYYDYKHFSKIEEIGSGGFGAVSRANWKNSSKYFALKSFFNPDEAAIKELAHEVTKKRDAYMKPLNKNSYYNLLA
jgi:hypothetical protein